MCLVKHLHHKGSIKLYNKESFPFICDSYTLAKAHELPFLPINKRSSFPFVLIHLDL